MTARWLAGPTHTNAMARGYTRTRWLRATHERDGSGLHTMARGYTQTRGSVLHSLCYYAHRITNSAMINHLGGGSGQPPIDILYHLGRGAGPPS